MGHPWQDAQKVEIRSTMDTTTQYAWFWKPPASAPLLVGLHTWSADYNQDSGV